MHRFNRWKMLALGISVAVSLILSNCSTIAQSERGYFVATNGFDDNPGTIARPFKTIQKCATLAQPGETCWIREGVYREKIQPPASGTPEARITFAAYQDEEVTISGTEPVTEWVKEQDSIYRSPIELPVDSYSDTGFLANQLFVNGKMMPEARFPNLGEKQDFLRPQLLGGGLKSAGGTAAVIENKEIPNLTLGWQGANVWANEWYTTRTGTITSGNSPSLTAEMTAAWDRGSFWLYFFGKKELLDSPGEWFYQGDNNNLFFWSPDSAVPTSVEVKQRNYAFDLRDRSFISLHNLNLFANTITTSDRSQGIEINGINAKYVSHHMTLPPLPKAEKAPDSDSAIFLASHAHDTGIQLRGSNHILKNSVIEWSSGNGVLLEGNNHTVTNNIITSTNYMVSYAAPVRINGRGHKITYNTISRSGRDAMTIDWHTAGTDARNLEIAYNDISRFGMLSTDLGAIYVCCHVNLEGGSIHHNWIRDTAAFSPHWGTRGIYLDIESFNSTIHHNAVWNLIGGQDNYNLLAGSPRGVERIYNNTFLGEVAVAGDTTIAQNNIFARTKQDSLDVGKRSYNLFNRGVQALRSSQESRQIKPEFALQPTSPAIERGVVIPGITDGFAGDAPDIGAYESGREPWKPGATLNHPER